MTAGRPGIEPQSWVFPSCILTAIRGVEEHRPLNSLSQKAVIQGVTCTFCITYWYYLFLGGSLPVFWVNLLGYVQILKSTSLLFKRNFGYPWWVQTEVLQVWFSRDERVSLWPVIGTNTNQWSVSLACDWYKCKPSFAWMAVLWLGKHLCLEKIEKWFPKAELGLTHVLGSLCLSRMKQINGTRKSELNAAEHC